MKKIIFIYFVLLFFQKQAFSQKIRPEKILFIGDSHLAGPFGYSFDLLLRQNFSHVESYGSCGSILLHWRTGRPTSCGYFSKNAQGKQTIKLKYPTPILLNLLEKIGPKDYVILEFSWNYMGQSFERINSDINESINLIKKTGAKCFWITNPAWRTNAKISPLKNLEYVTQAIASSCEIFVSHETMKYPDLGGDGVHYSFKQGIPIAKKWALDAYDAFEIYYAKTLDENANESGHH
jgi:hypothetical protein